MITLNISTETKAESDEILNIFLNNKVEVQLIETQNTVKNHKGTFKIEKGYSLKIFDIKRDTFKTKIWNPLKKLLDLKCAFIIVENEYMGCILNWPGVFCKTKCITCV